MDVILFGATGMIGHAALLEALDDAEVTRVRTVGRTTVALDHPKLTQITHDDFLDFTAIEAHLTGATACIWCLGVPSAGMDEASYRRVTVDYTRAAATTLLRLNPRIAFCFVSGAGTDGSERTRTMWARVKGAAENMLLGMGFDRAVMFRPAYVQPERGVTSKVRTYRTLYAVMSPLYPALGRLLPAHCTTSSSLGRALIAAARHGTDSPILETPAINALAARTRRASR